MRRRGQSLFVVTCSTCSLSSLQGLNSLKACICIFMTQLKPKELGLQEKKKKKDKKNQKTKTSMGQGKKFLVLKGFLSHYSKRSGLHSCELSGNKSSRGRILCWLVFLSSVSGHVIPSHFASFPLYRAFFPVYWKVLSTPFFTAPFLVAQPQPPGNSSSNRFCLFCCCELAYCCWNHNMP